MTGDTLSEQTGSGRANVLPDLIFMPPGLKEWGDAERKTANDHLQSAALGCSTAPENVQIQIIQKAIDDVKAGDFSVGSTWFDLALQRAANFPFIAWLSLRRRHENIFPSENTVADHLQTLAEPVLYSVQKNVYELWDIGIPGPVELKNLQGTLAKERSGTEENSVNVPTS